MRKKPCCKDVEGFRGSDTYETDLIFFAIKASRAEGKDKLKYLLQLKQLAECEYDFHKSKSHYLRRKKGKK